MLYNPPIGSALEKLGAAIRSRGVLADRLREFAVLIVAHDLESPYEWRAHLPIAEKVGVTDAHLASIREHASSSSELAEADGLVLEATRLILGGSDLSDDLYGRASSLLGFAGLFELTTLIGYYRLLAAQLRLFRIPH